MAAGGATARKSTRDAGVRAERSGLCESPSVAMSVVHKFPWALSMAMSMEYVIVCVSVSCLARFWVYSGEISRLARRSGRSIGSCALCRRVGHVSNDYSNLYSFVSFLLSKLAYQF